MQPNRLVTVNDSSNVAFIRYYLDESRMVVEFQSGSMYAYENVKPEEFGALTCADSVGSAFNKMKGRWTPIKVF